MLRKRDNNLEENKIKDYFYEFNYEYLFGDKNPILKLNEGTVNYEIDLFEVYCDNSL